MKNPDSKMTGFIFCAASFLIVCIGPLAVIAVPPNPLPFEARQPDGTKVTLRARGTERVHWYEDADGFSVIISGGKFVYAKLDAEGNFLPTDLVAGVSDPHSANLVTGLRPAQTASKRLFLAPAAIIAIPGVPAAPQPIPITPAKGRVKNLVVLCIFKDHAAGKKEDTTRKRED